MAISKPTRYVDWATESETSPVGTQNKVPVPDEFKLSGIKYRERLPRAYLNDQLNKVGEWVRYLEDQINQLNLDAGSGVLQTAYPVGAIYFTTSSQDPSDILGFGSWTRIEGKFIVARDPNDTDFDGVGETGGSKDHSHTHSLQTSTAGEHNHAISASNVGDLSSTEPAPVSDAATTENAGSHNHTITGSIDTQSNLPPYYTVNVFERTA